MNKDIHIIDKIFMSIGAIASLALGIGVYKSWKLDKRYSEIKKLINTSIDLSTYKKHTDVIKVNSYREYLTELLQRCIYQDNYAEDTRMRDAINSINESDYDELSRKFKDAIIAIKNSSLQPELDVEIIQKLHTQILTTIKSMNRSNTRTQSDWGAALGGLAMVGVVGGAIWLAYTAERDRVRKIEEALRKMHSSISFSGYDRSDERVIKKFFSDLDKMVRDTIIDSIKVEVADYTEAEAVTRMNERRYSALKESFKDAVKAIKRSSPDKERDLSTLKSYYRDFVAISVERTTPYINRNLNNRPQQVIVHHTGSNMRYRNGY